MKVKIIVFVGVLCLGLITDVTASGCHWCNKDLRMCKRPCRYRGYHRKSRCMLPCYREAIYCLNMCEHEFPFAMSQLDADDTKTKPKVGRHGI